MKSGRLSDAIDLSVLVDIISNMAGMMVLMTCITIVLQQNAKPTPASTDSVKPITFPMAYLPKKNSVHICFRHGKLYALPERELLEAMVAHTGKTGTPADQIDIEVEGVYAMLIPTPTDTGFRFVYFLDPQGGVPLDDAKAVVDTLDELLATYPADRFFVSAYVWPSEFDDFREAREYLHGRGVEVGWSALTPVEATKPGMQYADVAYSIGDYASGMSSIKAN